MAMFPFMKTEEDDNLLQEIPQSPSYEDSIRGIAGYQPEEAPMASASPDTTVSPTAPTKLADLLPAKAEADTSKTPEAPMSAQDKLLKEYLQLSGKDTTDELKSARDRDRMLKIGGSIGDALATYINAQGQMNAKVPGVQVQQGAGLGKVAEMFATAPEIASDLKDRREALLAEYKLLSTSKNGEKIYQTKSGIVKIDKDGKPIELYSDPIVKKNLEINEKRLAQGWDRLGLSTTAEGRKAQELEFKKNEANELKPKELETLTALDSTLDSLDRLSGLNKDFWTGPIEGRVAQLSRILGTDSEAKTKLAAQMEMVLSKYGKQISGTAVGEEEFQRLKSQLPSETDSDAAFSAKFSNFKEELESSRNRFIENYGKVRNVESFRERTPLQQAEQSQVKGVAIGTKQNKIDPKTGATIPYIRTEAGWEPIK